ncbi:MAG: hypothetical protein ACJA1R_003092, partial [Flavobacteriales bacterium]
GQSSRSTFKLTAQAFSERSQPDLGLPSQTSLSDARASGLQEEPQTSVARLLVTQTRDPEKWRTRDALRRLAGRADY